MFLKPLWGLIWLELFKLKWTILGGMSILLLAGFFLFLKNESNGIFGELSRNQGTHLDFLRMLFPYMTVVFCAAFSKKVIGDDIEGEVWKYHRQLPFHPAFHYAVKFGVGLSCIWLCITMLQLFFMYLSREELIYSFERLTFPLIRLFSVSAAVWGTLLLATFLGSLRWPIFIVLGAVYMIYGISVTPFNLIEDEGVLEEITSLPKFEQLIQAWAICIGTFTLGLLLNIKRLYFVYSFIYQKIPFQVKLIAFLLGFVGLLILTNIDEPNDFYEESELISFGETLEVNDASVPIKVWFPKDTSESLRNALEVCLEETVEKIQYFKSFLSFEGDFPSFVVSIRPDFQSFEEWEWAYYGDQHIIFFRMNPELEDYKNLSNMFAFIYAVTLLEERVLNLPLAEEQSGWLAMGLGSWLFPFSKVDDEILGDKEPLEWMQNHKLDDWHTVRDGEWVDDKYVEGPVMSFYQRVGLGKAILKAMEGTHGKEWVREFCREVLFYDSRLPLSSESNFVKGWPYLAKKYMHYKTHGACDVYIKKGGDLAKLLDKAKVEYEKIWLKEQP